MGGGRDDREARARDHRSPVSRRLVLGVGAAGAVGVVATLITRGLRLDLPEPPPPPPTRRPVPDEALLIGTVRQLRGTGLLGERLGTAEA
jgi:hypothetical protein